MRLQIISQLCSRLNSVVSSMGKIDGEQEAVMFTNLRELHAKAPEQLRELIGLELRRRQLLRELIAVHVRMEHLKHEIESRKGLTTASKQ